MNTNEIRFYLHSYDNLKKEIQHLQTQLEEYRKMNISGIKAQIITDMPIYHTNNTSKVELLALTRLEYIGDLENEMDSKMRLLRAINSVYFYLKKPKRIIVEMRYFIQEQGKRKPSWKEIADKVGETEEKCRQIDCRIIRAIQIRYLENTEGKKHQQTA
jgi:DNA-directed RNA polymerase sigma subunit (sigma70/sigma32)